MGKRSFETAVNGHDDAVHSAGHVDSPDPQSEAESHDEEDADDADDDGNLDQEEKPKSVTHSGRPTKKQKKQITAQEVQMARETAELFKSNIFKLQIDELISELKIKESHISRIEKVLHRLHDCILQVTPVEDLSLEEAQKLINPKKVAIAFPDPTPVKANYKFAYLAPEDVSLVGSFGLKTGIAQPNGLAIDISLTMPKSLFLPKDYLNYRALYKRSFYMAYLAEQLISITRKNHLPVKISYTYLNEDPLCPVLTLHSIHTDVEEDLSFYKTKFSINLLIAIPFGIFESKKLLPDRNCIRVQNTSENQELPPTPYYNSSVMSLTTYDYYLKFLYANKKSAEAFKDACSLGRLWLRQRGFGSSLSNGGFGNFEFAILLSALLSGGGTNGNKILLHGFSSYQLFKGAIKYLATMDLCSGYVSFSSQIGEATTCKYNPAGFNTPTIFDKTVKINLLWKMTKSSYQDLQRNAIDTFALLSDVVYDRFDPILLQNTHNDEMKYDLLYDIEIPDDVHDSYGALEKISFISFDNYVRHKLHSVLSKALGDRIFSIVISNTKTTSTFPLNKRNPVSTHSKRYKIGIQLNTDECDKLVTKGPTDSEDEQAAKFRAFWGPKTTLRKFKDGNIQHCVLWEVQAHEPVVSQIILYSLSIHFHPSINKYIKLNVLEFNSKLPVPLNMNAASVSVTSTMNFTFVKNSFESLSKIMYNLTLPLGIKAMMATSSGLRGTSLLQPVPFAISNPDFWNDVVLQFESSSRWPDEIKAMEKTKTAFLLKISDILNKETAYKTFLTRDESIPFNGDITLLNVLTPEGCGFRFRVLSERDEVLYLRAVTNSGKEKALVQDIYFKFNQKYFGSIKHSRTIGILSTNFPYYSPTVRLFKKWLDAHALLCHFNEELVELIALKPFLDPAPFSVPNSVEKGFLQILNFMANWNWKDDPLILDLVKTKISEDDQFENKLSDKLTVQAYQLIQDNFAKIRQSDPSGLKTQYFVGSRDDPSGVLWSNKVSLPIASRLTGLARAATQLVKTQGLSQETLELMFTPALDDFEFVIKMKSADHSSTMGLAQAGEFKNLALKVMSFPLRVTSKYDLTPMFVDEVNKKFGGQIIFSHRKCPAVFGENSNIVCGVFVPSAQGKMKFRVTLGANVKPTDDPEEVEVNKEDIFDQIKLLGGDLIKSIRFRQ